MTTELVPPLGEVTTRELRALAAEVFENQETDGKFYHEVACMVGAFQQRLGSNWGMLDEDFIRELLVGYLVEEMERYINAVYSVAVEYPCGNPEVSYRPETW